jgi:hypothetical protein
VDSLLLKKAKRTTIQEFPIGSRKLFVSVRAAYVSGYARPAADYLRTHGNTGRHIGAWAERGGLDPRQLKEAVRSIAKYTRRSKLAYKIYEDGLGPENRGTWKGQKFWSGVARVEDGEVIEVHTFEEARRADHNAAFYFSPDSEEKRNEGVYTFFWVEERTGKVETQYEPRDNKEDEKASEIKARIVRNIERQITIGTKDQTRLFAAAFDYHYTDEQGIEHDVCHICKSHVSTHPDAGMSLEFCGDCGKPTCPEHRDETLAARCTVCQGRHKAAVEPDAIFDDEFEDMVRFMNTLGWGKVGYSTFYPPAAAMNAIRVYSDGWKHSWFEKPKGEGTTLAELKDYLQKSGLSKYSRPPAKRQGPTIDVEPLKPGLPE